MASCIDGGLCSVIVGFLDIILQPLCFCGSGGSDSAVYQRKGINQANQVAKSDLD
jgi:hypothetical protein